MSLREREESIINARNRTAELHQAIHSARSRALNASLSQVASRVSPLPPQSCNLRLCSTLRGHQTKIASAKWSSDSKKIISASQDGYIIIWNALTGYKRQAIALDSPYVLACAISPNGNLFASAGLENTCTIYKAHRGSNPAPFESPAVQVLQGHKAYISECDFLDNNVVVTASGDMCVRSWDIIKGVCKDEFADHIGDVICMDVGNNCFVSGGSDGLAKVWDVRSTTPSRSYRVSRADVSCVRFFPNDYAFLAGSEDGIVRMFDIRSDGEIASYSLAAKVTGASNRSISSVSSQFENSGLLSVDFSASGRLFYASYADYGCFIWDTLRGDMLGRLGTDSHGLFNRVQTSPDGDGVLTASWDSTVRIWSI